MPQTTITALCIADTMWAASGPTTNYNGYDHTRVAGSGTAETKMGPLKFNVSGIGDKNVVSAKLRIRGKGAQAVPNLNVRTCPNTWTEATTWNTKPTLGSVLTTTPVVAETWTETDVTSAVTGDGEVSFVLTRTVSGSDNIVYTRESAYDPELVIVVEDDTPPPVDNPPTTPQNLAAVSVPRVDISWSPSTDDNGVAGYRLYRDSVLLATQTVTSYTDYDVVEGGVYAYAVEAFDTANQASARTAAVEVTVPFDRGGELPDTTAPSVPGNFQASYSSPSVYLTWDVSTDDVGVTEYQVKRNNTNLATTTTNSYMDSTVAEGLTYTYKVAARDEAGNVSSDSTSASVTIPSDPPPPTGGYFVITQAELDALPTSGTPWTNMLSRADGTWPVLEMENNENKRSAYMVAAGFVYAKTGNVTYKNKVVAALQQIEQYQASSSSYTLAWVRQVAGFGIAANLVGYNPQSWKDWMGYALTAVCPQHGRWNTIKKTSEDTANNWGTWALPCRMIIALTRGDTTDFDFCANIFRGWLGDTNAYYAFNPTSGYDPTWHCDNVPVASYHGPGVNYACTPGKDGALIEDICRSAGSYPSIDYEGRTYTWEALGGATLSARIMHYNGHPNVWTYSNNALKRAALFNDREANNWPPQYAVCYETAVTLNKVYGLTFPVGAYGHGRQFGYTDWLPTPV